MNLPIPEAALKQHVIALGKTGSGKSSALRVLVEGILGAKQRVCILDPKGDWWGLKLSHTGKSAGFPVVIFGGEHADVPINAHAGAQVAELVATGNRPCIIDLGGWTVADRTRFFIEYAQGLFRGNKAPLFQVIATACAALAQVLHQRADDVDHHSKIIRAWIDAHTSRDRKGASSFAPRKNAVQREAAASVALDAESLSTQHSALSTSFGACERAIINVLAQRNGLSKEHVAVLAAYQHDTGHFRDSLGRLRTAGIVEGQSASLNLKAAPSETPAPIGGVVDILARWRRKFGKCENLVLDRLVEIGAMSKQELADRTGYRADTGHFRDSLGRLRSANLITKGGQIKLSAYVTD